MAHLQFAYSRGLKHGIRPAKQRESFQVKQLEIIIFEIGVMKT